MKSLISILIIAVFTTLNVANAQDSPDKLISHFFDQVEKGDYSEAVK